jgi:hypothetical protein
LEARGLDYLALGLVNRGTGIEVGREFRVWG